MLPKTGRARGVSLREAFPGGQFVRGGDLRVTTCSSDASRVRPGDLFVAVDGGRRDGHEDAAIAAQRGAAGIVCERLLPIDLPQVIVRDSREALGKVAHELAGRPTDHLQTIGVSGTQGKTVTTLLMASVLEAARQSPGVLSSIGHSDGERQLPADSATPPTLATVRWLSRMAANECQSAVVEVSRRALMERRLAAASFDAILLTSLRPAATDDVGTLLSERKLHGRLFEQLKSSGFVVANADDANVQAVIGKVSAPVITYALHGDAEIRATVLERHASEQTFLLHAGSDTVPVRTEMIGDHHVLNCLAVAAAGLVLGIDLPTIARGLEAQRRMPGRLERLECGQSFRVFVDSARTPESLAAALKSVRHVTSGRLICVMGSEGDRNKKLRPHLGRVLERMADEVILTNDNPRRETPLEIMHQILDGMTDAGGPRLLPNRAKAIEWALDQAQPGDAVLIAGKGDRNWQIVGTQRQPHDDREIARRWLYDVGARREYAACRFA